MKNSMDSDMVEVIARRLHAKHVREVNRWDWANRTETDVRERIEANWPHAKRDFLPQAKAALSAILETHAIVPREPTEAMLQAGIDLSAGGEPDVIFAAMIAAHEGEG